MSGEGQKSLAPFQHASTLKKSEVTKYPSTPSAAGSYSYS